MIKYYLSRKKEVKKDKFSKLMLSTTDYILEIISKKKIKVKKTNESIQKSLIALFG